MLDRLTSFDAAIEAAQAEADSTRPRRPGPALRHATIALPNGTPLLRSVDLALTAGRNLLVTGPSGAGKSTLFRALAGIWPFGSGEIATCAEGRVMLLPQKPYVPVGTLREAVAYPAGEDIFPMRR